MTFEEFVNFINKGLIKLTRYKGGNFSNIAMTTTPVIIDEHPNQRWIFKSPKQMKPNDFPMNISERVVRKFREIHPEIPIYQLDGNQGFFYPFFPEKTVDDNLIADTILSIYQHTRQVIADGCLPSNFAFYQDKLVCIDMDLAIRRGSFLSDAYYNGLVSTYIYDQFFASVENSHGNPKTIELIKILFFLEEQLDDIDFDTKKITQWMIGKLKVYKDSNHPISLSTIELLHRIELYNPEIDAVLLNPIFIEEFKTQEREIPEILHEIEAMYHAKKSIEPSFLSQPPMTRHAFFSSLSKRQLQFEDGAAASSSATLNAAV